MAVEEDDLYSVLELTADASGTDIRKSYQRLAKKVLITLVHHNNKICKATLHIFFSIILTSSLRVCQRCKEEKL